MLHPQSMIRRTKLAGESTDRLEQLCNCQIEGFLNGLCGPQIGLLFALLKVRHEILMKSGHLGKVDLSPAALSLQLPFPLPQGDTKVTDIIPS